MPMVIFMTPKMRLPSMVGNTILDALLVEYDETNRSVALPKIIFNHNITSPKSMHVFDGLVEDFTEADNVL